MLVSWGCCDGGSAPSSLHGLSVHHIEGEHEVLGLVATATTAQIHILIRVCADATQAALKFLSDILRVRAMGEP